MRSKQLLALALAAALTLPAGANVILAAGALQ